MPPSKASRTSTAWSHEFDTVRREKLFQNPPKDHTAYPALKEAISPHIKSFNALFEPDGLISKAIEDIGTVTILDGDTRMGPEGKNKVDVKVKQVLVQKSMLPDTNKFSTRNREILPSECRERHVTYRGKLSAVFEYRINDGDPKEVIRELGNLPLMVMVSRHLQELFRVLTARSPTSATSRITHQHNWCREKKSRRS